MLLGEEHRRPNGERGVLMLVCAAKRERVVRRAAVLRREVDSFSTCGRAEIFAIGKDFASLLRGLSAHDVERHALSRRDDGHALLDDARLVMRDTFERAATAVGVLHGDVRDDGDFWDDDVRRVEKPAQTDLNDGIVDVLFGEIIERRRRQHLELGRLLQSLGEHRLRRLFCSRDRRREIRLARLLAIDDEALRVRSEMRRGVESRPKARLRQNRRRHGADGAFAVRARDVHRPIPPFRVSEQLREPLDARKAELRAEDVETFEVRKTFLVVHFPTFLRVSPDRRGALRRPSSSPSPLRASRALFPRRRAVPS